MSMSSAMCAGITYFVFLWALSSLQGYFPSSVFFNCMSSSIKGAVACCIMSHWVQNLCRSFYSMRRINRGSWKNPALDMSILLSAILIFHGLILLLAAETSEQHRYLVIIIIFPNIGFMVLKTTGLNSVFQCKNPLWKIFTESWDIGKNVYGLFRDLCYKQQNQNTQNENGAQ